MSGEYICSPQSSSPALNGTRRQSISSFAIQVTSVPSNSSLNSMGMAEDESPSPRLLKRKATILNFGRSTFIKRHKYNVILGRRYVSKTVATVRRTVKMLDANCHVTPQIACATLALASEALSAPIDYTTLCRARKEVRDMKEEAILLKEERQLLIDELNELQTDIFTLEDDRDGIESEMVALREATNACVKNQSSSNLNSSVTSTPEAFEWASVINKSLSKSKEGSFCAEKCPHCGESMTFQNKWCAVTGQRHRSDAEKELDVLRRRLSAIARDELSRGFIADGSVVYHSDGDTPETSPRRRSRNWRDSPLSFSQYSDTRRHTDSSLFDADEDTMSESRRRRQSIASEGTPPLRLLRKPRAFQRAFGKDTGSQQDELPTPPLDYSTPPSRPQRAGTMAQGDHAKYTLSSAPTIPRIVNQHGSSSSLQSPTSPHTPPTVGLKREPTLPTSLFDSQLERTGTGSGGSFPRVKSVGTRGSLNDSPKQPVLRKSTMPMRIEADLHLEEVNTVDTNSDSSSVASDATLQQSEEHTRLDPLRGEGLLASQSF